MSLAAYKQKRDFKRTPEPGANPGTKTHRLNFVVQRHAASHLHYDFRLEMEGALKSWAVPKGPSMKAGEKRLAVHVEDHPLLYGKFYGEIPKGNYGAGIVDIWDNGIYEPVEKIKNSTAEKTLLAQYKNGNLKFILHGNYLNGEFALVKMHGQDKNWLLIKKADAHAVKDFNIEELKPVKAYGKNGISAEKKNRTPGFRGPGRHKKPTGGILEKPVSKNGRDNAGEANEVMEAGTKKVKCTNLTKIYFPEDGITKGDLINYYRRIHPYILPYLKNRPLSLNRHPNGINGQSFYQKDMNADQLPSWAKTAKLYSKSNRKYIDYLICNDEASLIYIANLGCIEINPWHSRYQHPDKPDYLMLDLDPGKIPFQKVVDTALVIKDICDELKIPSYCKTSGATGLHIYLPLAANYDYTHAKMFAELVANLTHARIPDITSVERSISKRTDKIYIDFLQNHKGQTLAAPYCVRPRPLATVSAPLLWKEVNHQLTPQQFTIHTIENRLKRMGDLWKGILGKGIDLKLALGKINKLN